MSNENDDSNSTDEQMASTGNRFGSSPDSAFDDVKPGSSAKPRTNFSIDSLLNKKIEQLTKDENVDDNFRGVPPGFGAPTFRMPPPYSVPPLMPNIMLDFPWTAAASGAHSRWPLGGSSSLMQSTMPVFPFPLGHTERRVAQSNKPAPVKKYKCDVCGKAFSRSNTLVTHKSYCKCTSIRILFKCYWELTTVRLENVKKVLSSLEKRIHTGEKPFSCEHCGRAFRQPGNLTRHRLTHTTVKPYVCSQCGKAFNRASNLHTHARTHSNYRPFICNYCGKGFHQKIDMKIHCYTHTGEKPHKCNKCGRGFKQLTHLNYHMRTHADTKMFHCQTCGKGFNQKGNLQAHQYCHTGEKPFKCEVCDKGFTLSSTLNAHKRTHTRVKPYACHHCGKDFYQKNSLKSHLLASHPYTAGQSLL